LNKQKRQDRQQALMMVGTPAPEPFPAVNTRNPKKRSSGNSRGRKKKVYKPLPSERWQLG